MSCGSSVRTLVTASRTSFTARSTCVSSWNSTTVSEVPSVMVEEMCFTPCTPAIEVSTTLVTCVSSSLGAAPGWVMVTETIGTSIFGMRVIGSRSKV